MKTVLFASVVIVLSYVAALPLRREPAYAQTEPETAAVQRVLDEQKKALADAQQTIVTMAAKLQAIEARRPADPCTKTTTELGCNPNDKTFDNAPLIQAALDKGYNVELDAGPLYYTSPLRLPPGMGCVIKGQSSALRYWAKGATALAPFKPDQQCLIEIPSDPEKSVGHNTTICDLALYVKSDQCDGIRIHGGRAVGIENVMIEKANRGILIAPTGGVYATSIERCSLFDCQTGIEVNNGENVCCLDVQATQIIGGKFGIVQNGWKRGAVYTAIACEGQSENPTKWTDSRATLIGCYFEGQTAGVSAGILAKDSKLTIIDTSAGTIRANLNTQINWVGDNMQAGTLSY